MVWDVKEGAEDSTYSWPVFVFSQMEREEGDTLLLNKEFDAGIDHLQYLHRCLCPLEDDVFIILVSLFLYSDGDPSSLEDCRGW